MRVIAPPGLTSGRSLRSVDIPSLRMELQASCIASIKNCALGKCLPEAARIDAQILLQRSQRDLLRVTSPQSNVAAWQVHSIIPTTIRSVLEILVRGKKPPQIFPQSTS